MVMNLLIVVFLLLMAYWWSLQGLFSAWLHLGLVIVSGAIALAVWEPMAYWLLNTSAHAAFNAWGVSLLAPFGVALLLLRFAVDKLVPKNMHFPDLANKIGGGVLGALAAVLTAGIVVMGVNFLPLGSRIAGYEPYTIGTNGQITLNENSQLWIKVDRYTAAFFAKLSGGAFASKTPMALYMPDMAQAAGAFRLHIDPNSSIVAVPNTVTVTGAFSHTLPVAELDETVVAKLGDQLQAGKQLIVVDTRWLPEPRGTFDLDETLRLPPSHLSLVTTRANGQVVQHAPIALSRAEREGPRQCIPVVNHQAVLTSNRSEERVAISFLVDADEKPQHLFVRRLRLSVPTPNTEVENLVAMVGAVTEPKAEDTATAGRGNRTLERREGPIVGVEGVEVQINGKFPHFFSKNEALAFEYYQDTNKVLNGNKEIRKFVGNLSPKLKVEEVYEAPNRAIVRVKLDRERTASIFGEARALAGALNPPILRDSYGDIHQPIGYVLRRTDDTQKISIDRNNKIRAAAQLPIREMTSTDELYLYFDVPRESGRIINTFEIGTMKQELTEGLPVE